MTWHTPSKNWWRSTRAADAAHEKVMELRDAYGPPRQQQEPGGAQSETYETALRAWRDLARDELTAVNEYARDEGRPRSEVEAEVERAAAWPEDS